MATRSQSIERLIRDVCCAVQEARDRWHLYRAWELLQEHDAEGNTTGPLPYTDGALAEFEAAYAHDPEHVGIAHHLAIAHHARAWDLELRDDPRAPEEWKCALGYWRIVASSAEFWAEQKAKLQRCDADAATAFPDDMRRNLLESLLDIHVDFVRHYCESGAPERARYHVEIVKQARLPLRVKKRLKEKIFDAMTGSVPEAKAKQAYGSALTCVERFLSLFPDHLCALRMHNEICTAWVSGLSYRDNWEEILKIGRRAEPPAQVAADHPELNDNPLAKTALERLAMEFARRVYDRAQGYLAGSELGELPVCDQDSARASLEFAIAWCRVGHRCSSTGSPLRRLLAVCLHGHAGAMYHEMEEVIESIADRRAKLDTAMSLIRRVIAELEEASVLAPDEAAVSKDLESAGELKSMLEKQKDELWLSDLDIPGETEDAL